MIYLKSFNLPKDTWVDEYFSPTPYAPPKTFLMYMIS